MTGCGLESKSKSQSQSRILFFIVDRYRIVLIGVCCFIIIKTDHQSEIHRDHGVEIISQTAEKRMGVQGRAHLFSQPKILGIYSDIGIHIADAAAQVVQKTVGGGNGNIIAVVEIG